ncbi:hypothetical protein [Cypionkella sp.]|uniref:hypothetical protein n=1 Tax=Cypionkella sp. TaxID=2811411 RepID=UPI003751ECB3
MGIPSSIVASHGAAAVGRPLSTEGLAKPTLVLPERDRGQESLPMMQASLAHTSANELPKALAARLSVESVDGISLDHIPFVGDAAVLIDDLPAPEPPQAQIEQAPEAEPEKSVPAKAEEAIKDPISPDSKLAQAATQGYLAGREVVGQPAPQPPQPEQKQAAVAPPAVV